MFEYPITKFANAANNPNLDDFSQDNLVLCVFKSAPTMPYVEQRVLVHFDDLAEALAGFSDDPKKIAHPDFVIGLQEEGKAYLVEQTIVCDRNGEENHCESGVIPEFFQPNLAQTFNDNDRQVLMNLIEHRGVEEYITLSEKADIGTLLPLSDFSAENELARCHGYEMN